MPKSNALLNKFNRGLISPLALGRVDLENSAFFAETMTNWLPRSLGSMSIRPGTFYEVAAYDASKASFLIPFIFSVTDTAIIEINCGASGNATIRPLVSFAPITRTSVSTTVSNGDFSSAVNWTDADETGATSTISGGVLSLVGTTFAAAKRTQTITVAGGDQNKEHAFRFIVTQGQVTLRVGSSAGGDEYWPEERFGPGEYSLAFTPTGANVYLQILGYTKYTSIVDSIQIEGATAVTFDTGEEWPSDENFDSPKYDQSGDVIYLALDGHRQRKIQRHTADSRSWGFAKYEPLDGPFRVINTTGARISSSALTGDVTLTASKPLFKSTHVGGLFKLESIGQTVSVTLTGADQWSNPIKVIGTGASQRSFTITRATIGSNSVSLQRSVGEVGSWVTVGSVYTTNGTSTIDDNLDNQIIYYRVGIETGNYVAGTTTASLAFDTGSITGICRITAFTSSTSVSAIVLRELGNTAATQNWYEGAWSDYRGYPTAVALHRGRLFWAGKDKVWGSISDAYESFDEEFEGDAGTISRSLGSGPIDKINWMLSTDNLLIGGQWGEWVAKSSSFDEPLTPSNFNLQCTSTQGSAIPQAIKIDNQSLFVNRQAFRMFSYAYDFQINDYVAENLMKICPEITGGYAIKRIAIQRNPETMIHAILEDGSARILVYDKSEGVKSWVKFTAANWNGNNGDDGQIEDVIVLPGTYADNVVYVIRRFTTAEVLYLESWSGIIEDPQGLTGGDININYAPMDCKKLSVTCTLGVMTGLSYLNGETITVIGPSGRDLGTATVSAGSATISDTTFSGTVVVGLAYVAQFKSAKLAFAAGGGTALAQRKRLAQLGVIMYNSHYQGLYYGPDFDNLDPLPLVEAGRNTADAVSASVSSTIWAAYDYDMFPFGGRWDTDSRLCLQVTSPRFCTLLAAVVQVETHDKG